MYLFYTMANFQGTVLMITGVLLVVSIILIIIFLRNSKNELEWPPLVSECPDYWIDLSGNGSRCVNIHDLGTCINTDPSKKHLNMNFSTYDDCAKFNWAQGCGISWDGISYGYGKTNPCEPEPVEETA
jgi:hypothetical protein